MSPLPTILHLTYLLNCLYADIQPFTTPVQNAWLEQRINSVTDLCEAGVVLNEINAAAQRENAQWIFVNAHAHVDLQEKNTSYTILADARDWVAQLSVSFRFTDTNQVELTEMVAINPLTRGDDKGATTLFLVPNEAKRIKSIFERDTPTTTASFKQRLIAILNGLSETGWMTAESLTNIQAALESIRANPSSSKI